MFATKITDPENPPEVEGTKLRLPVLQNEPRRPTNLMIHLGPGVESNLDEALRVIIESVVNTSLALVGRTRAEIYATDGSTSLPLVLDDGLVANLREQAE